MFADEVLAHGGSLHVIIPFADYVSKFETPGDRDQYLRLMRRASKSEVLEHATTDEESYLNAGKRVVDTSDVLIAVWDGRPSRGLGGTADIVEYAVRKGVRIQHLNPLTQAVQ